MLKWMAKPPQSISSLAFPLKMPSFDVRNHWSGEVWEEDLERVSEGKKR